MSLCIFYSDCIAMRVLYFAIVALSIETWRIPGALTYLVGTPSYKKGGLLPAIKCKSYHITRSIKPLNAEDSQNEQVNDILSGTRIDKDGRIINKKRKLYSYGELEHVDDFFVGKYRVEWTVRGIKEKLRFRRRDSGSPPLRTSRFTFAGIGGFIIRLWLDGIYESEPGHIALSLIQQEHWTSLNSPIYISAGEVKRGPFFFRSSPYFAAIKSFCSLEDAVENNTLRIGIGLASR